MQAAKLAKGLNWLRSNQGVHEMHVGTYTWRAGSELSSLSGMPAMHARIPCPAVTYQSSFRERVNSVANSSARQVSAIP